MALGPELIINGNFEGTWSVNGFCTVPQGFSVTSGNTATRYIEESVAGGQLRVISDGSSGTITYQIPPLTIGVDYLCSFDLISIDPSGGASSMDLVNGNAIKYGSVNTAGYHEIPFTAANDTWIAIRNTGVVDFVVDNFSVKEVLITTVTTTTWTDSISPEVIGHKVYRDTVPSTGEIEIADVGMGVQVWEDSTALLGVDYEYEVQAYSATDETTDEQTNVNVKTVTTLAIPTGITLTEI